MTYYDDEQAWHEAQNEYMERYAPMATMSDAHSEWHRNAGVPMGQPGCPMDACHPPEPDFCGVCEEYADECTCDGAPVEQWEVTTPPEVYWNGEDDFPF